MIKDDRKSNILQILNERKYCTVQYLSKELYVAPITVRRDLKEMEDAGLILRCFGGATIPDHENREVPFEIRNKNNFNEKVEIAKKASRLIKNGDVIFMDASTTVSHIIEYVTDDMNITIITNSTYVLEKAKEKHIKCYSTGGMPVENSHALVGTIAENTIKSLFANVCFFSTQGINSEGVITDHSELETSLRRLMINNSQQQYYLFDSSKLSKQFAFRVTDINKITNYITDSDVDFK